VVLMDIRLPGMSGIECVARKLVDYFHSAAATSQGNDALSPLSQREVEILRLLAAGHAYKQIADDLSISINTIRTHIKRIYEKLHVHSRTEAIRLFQDSGGPGYHINM